MAIALNARWSLKKLALIWNDLFSCDAKCDTLKDSAYAWITRGWVSNIAAYNTVAWTKNAFVLIDWHYFKHDYVIVGQADSRYFCI